jgi:hypothetical protein
VRIAILGPLEVQSGGRCVDLSGARLQSLLARLADLLSDPMAWVSCCRVDLPG